jgi:hypothetical protein
MCLLKTVGWFEQFVLMDLSYRFAFLLQQPCLPNGIFGNHGIISPIAQKSGFFEKPDF